MTRIPLHYQIFLALVLGTAIGLLLNPGEAKLDATSATITSADGKIVLTETDSDGNPRFAETFDDAAFRQRYKRIAEQIGDAEGETEFNVVDRTVYFSEDAKSITAKYSRRYVPKGEEAEGGTVVHILDYKNPDELRQQAPQFADAFDEYAASPYRYIPVAAKWLGDLFLRLLKMITVPLIVTSLITGVAGLGTTGRLGSMFGKTLLYYLSTSVLAIITGITMVNLVRPGIGVELPGGGKGAIAGENQSLLGVFNGLVDNMIPPNPIAALAGGDFLAIITFSILFGLFMIRVGGRSGEVMREFFQAAFDVVMAMTTFIIRLAPIGVLGFIIYATASQGLGVFQTFGWYMLTVFLALMVHACVVLPLVLMIVARRSPIAFAQAMSPALLTAFSTASSNGTLPVTLTSVEDRAGVPNRISSFVLPLGATVNMDGTALYEAVAVLFIAQSYNGFVMPVEQQVIVAVTALLASVGAAGIPSAGLVMMAIVLQAVGLPLDAQGLIIAVDRVLDMCRTSVNVWSDSCGCAVLARLEPEESPA